MNLLAVVKEAINLLPHPVHWTMEKADIVTAIVNVTEKFAQETTNLLAQPVRRSAQNQEARPQIAGKNTDKSYLRGLAKRTLRAGSPSFRYQMVCAIYLEIIIPPLILFICCV
jgi:hypothetical protein